jgi:hypothetical protein
VHNTEYGCRRRLYKPVVVPISGKHKKENPEDKKYLKFLWDE